MAVFLSGRPREVDAELALADGFVAAWWPGTEGGGVTDVLMGDTDFQGKLPFAWPGAGGERFPFGYGLTLKDAKVVQPPIPSDVSEEVGL